MSNYTPTTEQVRETYAALCKTDAADAEFDRWHADEIRKAKDEAWQEGVETAAMAETGYSDPKVAGWTSLTNPYREQA